MSVQCVFTKVGKKPKIKAYTNFCQKPKLTEMKFETD